MFSLIHITPWHWAGFIVMILIPLAVDLGLLHRKAREVSVKEALAWTGVWVAFSLCFAGVLVPARGRDEALEFLTGYLIELSLSMDNVMVIAMIFTYFRVPHALQHRALFWGILGALLMRGAMIGLGSAMIARAHWILYIFGGFLVYTGFKMVFTDEAGVEPERNRVLRLARKLFPITQNFVGQKFVVVGAPAVAAHVGESERRVAGWFQSVALTPLGLVLVMVETTDLIFALDSIPAIFAVTQKPFIVFTSNVFAILGLRSLYFVLAGAIRYFGFLKIGLSVVLVFVGAKMLLEVVGFYIPTLVSLAIVASIIGGSMIISVVLARRSSDAASK